MAPSSTPRDLPPGIAPEQWPVQVVMGGAGMVVCQPPASSALITAEAAVRDRSDEWWAANGRNCFAVALALARSVAARLGFCLALEAPFERGTMVDNRSPEG